MSLLATVLVACGDAPRNPISPGPISNLVFSDQSQGETGYVCTLHRKGTVQTRPLNRTKFGIEEAPSRGRIFYRFQAVNPEGEALSRLICLIPDTPDAVAVLDHILGVERATARSDCYYEEEVDGTMCTHDEVVATAERDSTSEECDPYQELDFSCDDPCVEQEVVDSGDTTMTSFSCDTGGTTDPGTEPEGGGTGGSGSSYYLTDAEFEELCRPEEANCDPRRESAWTTQEVTGVEAAIALINSRCSDVGSLLAAWRSTGKLWLWDGRVQRAGVTLRGRTSPSTHDVYLWTGYNYNPEIDGPNPVNWPETLAHEGLHAMVLRGDVSLTHDEIRARAAYCAGVSGA